MNYSLFPTSSTSIFSNFVNFSIGKMHKRFLQSCLICTPTGALNKPHMQRENHCWMPAPISIVVLTNPFGATSFQRWNCEEEHAVAHFGTPTFAFSRNFKQGTSGQM